MSISSFFHAVANIFRSDKAKRAFELASQIVPVALPIVEQIAALTPNRTDDEILAAFEHFGMPAIPAGIADPGAALLALATAVVGEKMPPGTPKSILQLGIQAAVTGMKSSAQAAKA
jgi:hypothetical protein